MFTRLLRISLASAFICLLGSPAAAHGTPDTSGEFSENNLGITAYAQLLNPGHNIQNAFLVGLSFQSHSDHKVVFRNTHLTDTLTFTGHGYFFKLEDEFGGNVSLVTSKMSPPGLTWSSAPAGSTTTVPAGFNTSPQLWSSGAHVAIAFSRGTYGTIAPSIIHEHDWEQLGP